MTGPIELILKLRQHALIILMAAWPWEIYQRLPWDNWTVTKVAGGLLIALTLAEWAISRRVPFPRTRLEAPFAVLAVSFILSAALSENPAVSWAIVLQYASYLILFYAAVATVRSAKDARILALVFCASTSVVAMVAILCTAGVLEPTYLAMTRQTGRLVTEAAREGPMVRMAATATDLNQGVLPMVMALPLILWTLPSRRSWQWAVKLLLAFLLIAAMAVAFSRSSIVISLVILTIYLLSRTRQPRIWAVAFIIAAIISVVATPYLLALSERMIRGIAGEDASVINRLYVYQVAFELLPRYLLTGTGLGVSDSAVHRVADPALSGGLTVHSVPFKLMLEAGILAAIGYFWLYARIFRQAYHGLVETARPLTQQIGIASMWLWGAVFLISLIQPFMQLSLFPLILAIAIGPAAWNRKAIQEGLHHTAIRIPWRPQLAIFYLALLAAVVVGPNMVRYQQAVQVASEFVSRLHTGLELERAGDYEAAKGIHETEGALETLTGMTKRNDLGYAERALNVAQYPFVVSELSIQHDGPDIRATRNVLLARLQWVTGEIDDALASIANAQSIQPRFAHAHFLEGQIRWYAGDFPEAIAAFQHARELAVAPGNDPFEIAVRERDAAIEDLLARDHPDAYLQAAVAYRLQGHWARAVEIAENAIAAGYNQPHPHYILGVNHEIQGDAAAARKAYDKALAINPKHVDAAWRLNALSQEN